MANTTADFSFTDSTSGVSRRSSASTAMGQRHLRSAPQGERSARFIQVQREKAAAFAACGYAKYTGRLGVCVATSDPGGIHLLNGLYDAKCDARECQSDLTGSPAAATAGFGVRTCPRNRPLNASCFRGTK
jgi:glyoxylate carboligase